MLPRVGAALSSFITPIVSSKTDSQGSQKRGQPQHRSQSEGKKPEKPQLTVVQDALAETAKEVAAAQRPALHAAAPPVTQAQASVTSSFLQLLNFIQGRHEAIRRWVGGRAYHAASGQKKNARFRKGTMLDQKAE